MDFNKLLAQREVKEAIVQGDPVQPVRTENPAFRPPEGWTPPASKKAKPSRAIKGSKRQNWKCCAFYLDPAVKTRLEAVLMKQKLAGNQTVADQSEAVNQALVAWLAKAEKAVS